MKTKPSSRQCLPNRKTDWDTAIADAEALKAEKEEQARGLAAAIRMFKRRRDAGEPWPGTAEAESVDVAERAGG
jgi:hypothetical protein